MLASNQTKFIIHFGNELNLSLFELKPAIDSANVSFLLIVSLLHTFYLIFKPASWN